MNAKLLLILPLAMLMASGCVSKSGVQKMIDTNNETVVNPRISTVEDELVETRRQSDTQRKVLIRHFELLGDLSTNALTQLRGK